MPHKPPTHRPHGWRSRQQQLAELDLARGPSSKRGYDGDWKKLRARFLSENPICCVEDCHEPATVVDHIVTIRENPGLRLVWSNLRPMCHKHHSARTARDHSWHRKG
jgi:5-methylcytosine-specific restriction endonuclease McrA